MGKQIGVNEHGKQRWNEMAVYATGVGATYSNVGVDMLSTQARNKPSISTYIVCVFLHDRYLETWNCETMQNP